MVFNEPKKAIAPHAEFFFRKQWDRAGFQLVTLLFTAFTLSDMVRDKCGTNVGQQRDKNGELLVKRSVINILTKMTPKSL